MISYNITELTKDYLLFLTGLNSNINEYSIILDNYKNTYNIFTIEIDETFIANFDKNIHDISNKINQLNTIKIYIIGHSYGCIVLKYICEKLKNINKYCILIEPTNSTSISSINKNNNISNIIKDKISEKINECKNISIFNQKNLLITYINISNLKNVIDCTSNNLNNFDNFNYINGIFLYNSLLIKINSCKELYDDNNTHFSIIPFEEETLIKNIIPHNLHLQFPNKIINFIDKFTK